MEANKKNMEENKKNMEAITGNQKLFIVSGLNSVCPLVSLAGLSNESLGCL